MDAVAAQESFSHPAPGRLGRLWSRITGTGLDASWSRGVDVSFYQGTIDWERMAAAISFAVVKATQGLSIKDRQFDANWAALASRGVFRSAYHFFEPDQDPVQQARFFVATVGSGWDFPLVLDCEKRPAPGVPMPAAAIKACLDEIERLTGQKPIIYTGVSVWNQMGGVAWARNHPLWVAQYPYKNAEKELYDDWSEVPPGSRPKTPTDWDGVWHLWQFTPSGDGKGLGAQSYGLDLNSANGDIREIFGPVPEPPDGIPVYESLTNGLRIRTGPSLNSDVIGQLNIGDLRYVVETVEAEGYLWGNHTAPEMWSAVRSLTGSAIFMRLVSSGGSNPAARVAPDTEPPAPFNKKTVAEDSKAE